MPAVFMSKDWITTVPSALCRGSQLLQTKGGSGGVSDSHRWPSIWVSDVLAPACAACSIWVNTQSENSLGCKQNSIISLGIFQAKQSKCPFVGVVQCKSKIVSFLIAARNGQAFNWAHKQHTPRMAKRARCALIFCWRGKHETEIHLSWYSWERFFFWRGKDFFPLLTKTRARFLPFKLFQFPGVCKLAMPVGVYFCLE